MKYTKSLMLLVLLLVLSLMVSCGEVTGETEDGDAAIVGDGCQNDADCAVESTNMTCNTLQGICIDQGLCEIDVDCERLFGMIMPYCNIYGLCIPAEPINQPDGDGSQPDGDEVSVTDGDDTAPPTDGDEIIEPDGDDSGQIDGDEELIDPDPDLDLTPVPCDNNAGLQVPTIVVTPNAADFGAVRIGESGSVFLEVCNSSGVDLAVTAMQFSRGISAEFYKYHDVLPITIEAGYAVPVLLVYVPRDNVPDNGFLNILSNDPNSPEVSIPLISSVKAAPWLEVIPRIVQFTGINPGDQLTKVVQVTNIGAASTTVFDLIIQGGASSAYSILDVTDHYGAAATKPFPLEPNESMTITVMHTMGDVATDDLLIMPWIDDNIEREKRVELITSDRSMCAVPNAGQDQTVGPLDTVLLDGSLSYDPNGVILGYKWEWALKPPDAYRAIIKDGFGNNIEGQWANEPYPNFYAEIAGNYSVKLTVREDEPACDGVNVDTVEIFAVPSSTIHVKLTWTASGNDHDLHLIRPGGYFTRGETGNVTDCHWQNCDTKNGISFPCPPRGCPGPGLAPDWGSQGSRFDDPFLDIDDIPGMGPENINLSLPELGDYTVIVENYSGSDSNVSVKVEIWLFGILEEIYVHQPPNYASNNHWNVCTLRIHDPTTIEIIPIDTIEGS